MKLLFQHSEIDLKFLKNFYCKLLSTYQDVTAAIFHVLKVLMIALINRSTLIIRNMVKSLYSCNLVLILIILRSGRSEESLSLLAIRYYKQFTNLLIFIN